MERLTRVLERKFLDATALGQAPSVPFDRSRPWHSVWTAACEEFGFWHCQFEELALIILTKSGQLFEIITVKAPVEPGTQSSAPQSVHSKAKRRKTRPTSDTRVHRESNGVFTHNRRGVALCPDFQSGSCPNGRGNTCGIRIIRTSVTSVSQNVMVAARATCHQKNRSPKELGKG